METAKKIKNKRIVIDARNSGTSTGRYTDKLIENLQVIDRVNQYIIILNATRFNEVKLIAPNFSKVKTKYKEFTFGEQLGFAWQLYRLRADLVHFAMVQQPLLYVKKSVTTIHDLTTVRFRNPAKPLLWYYLKLPPYWFVIQIVFRRAKAIITPTQYVLKDLIRFTKHRPAHALHTYESADLIKEAPEPVVNLIGKQFILYVGRPTPHKNLERLMDSFKNLVEKYPELYLVLAGKKDALMEQHENYALEYGIKNVIVTGFVSEGSLRWLYEHTACYVFPSLSEGFGLPGLEAMRHGALVASSKATCLPEVYGEAAHYFSPYSINEMTEAIHDVLSNNKLRIELARKSKKLVTKYSWLRMAEQTKKVYESVLKQKI